MKVSKTIAALAGCLLLGCGGAEVLDFTTAESGAGGNKSDSGWIGADSFEVDALVRGTVSHDLSGDWAHLETDEDAQIKLVDLQLKFMKTTAESHGWRFNQLADTIDVQSVTATEDGVELEYVAIVDMLGRLTGDVPTLEDLNPRMFTARVPVVPDGFGYSTMEACSEVDGSHSVRDYNFHYYFQPDQADCDLELNDAVIEITEVFEVPVTYPEYDQLMRPLDDQTVGFTAALVPNRGDNDPLSRFNAHADMLERDLGLVGVDMEDGAFRRYTWQESGVAIVIDLYDPTVVPWSSDFGEHFRARLGDYALVHYNGHSSYGSKHLLDDPQAFSDQYQIITIHSCQSYAYYTRQIFRAKATEQDPTGFDRADVMATGKSSYPGGAPPTLGVLLRSLMQGMTAIADGEAHRAPDWLTIARQMKDSTWGDILYGMAGVRTNAWQPDSE